MKGVGEAGTIASTPAVVNSIVDALRPFGVSDITMPCTPERVWRAIQRQRRRQGNAEQHEARQNLASQGNSPQGIGEYRRAEGGMIPAKFEYVRPSSVADAVSALAEGGEDAKVIAGGQSLLPLLRLRLAYPELLVDVGGLDELRGVTDDGDHLLIGARTTHYQVVHDPLIARALRPAGAGGGHRRRPGCPAPRHAGRLDRARRPGRRPARGDPGAGRDADRARARTASARSRRATSSSTT